MISAINNETIEYPSNDEFYSPDEKYPEYPFHHIARKPNEVYRSVRGLFQQAGMDVEHYGTRLWNPFGKWISSGQTVFVLCNFVYHRRPRESLKEFQSKCTHGSIIRAVIDYIFIAVGPMGRIRFGNAPLQSCVWPRVLNQTGGQRVEAFYASVKAPVESADLRLFINEHSGNLLASKVEAHPEEMGVTIDLSQRSLLAALDGQETHYRVSDYNPEHTGSFHANGSHRYVLHRHIVESDVIFSIPKLKTHEKVGITCAIKGCVGAIGHKDCLAHHRRGTPQHGGDEFRSDPLGLLACLSSFHDLVQRSQPGTLYGHSLRLFLRGLRSLIRRIAPTMNGAWSGNDTCWRMAIDIARLIGYARRDGSISSELQRPHLALLDGIIGGDGNGPLNPRPVESGVLVFADNPVDLDFCATRIMGYDPNTLPIVREAARLTDLPLFEANNHCSSDPDDSQESFNASMAIVNGKVESLEDLGKFAARPYRLPKGWSR
ncbi:DUF362 domain-containing protein [Planctomycetota bacterium]